MVHLDISETSQVLSVIGGYICIVGLVSFFLKEKMFMSEPLVALLIGVAFGPIGADIFNPFRWVGYDQHQLESLSFQVSRIVIAIQVLFTGISLPKAYCWRHRLSLFVLLIPVMTCAWFVSALLVWAFIPNLTFLEALVVGSCVTPTDPVLANSICKEKYVPLEVRNIILAEAGANDGLGFPFLNPVSSLGEAIGQWFYNVLLYQILLSVLIGAVIGYIARRCLKYCEGRNLIDRESFLAFGVALTFFTVGWVGIIGSDDILCCFVVGNSLTWDDWFRIRSEEDSFQEVIDMLLNSAVFLYIGAVIPWNEFGNYWDITPWRLVLLGITVMLARRLPWVLLAKKFIPPISSSWKDALFTGYFGPIGVGAVFYIEVAHHAIPDDGTRERLRAVVAPVVYFMVLTSVIVHGITIPIGKSMQHTLTLTRSKSGAQFISRLPPPVPFGGALPTHDTNATSEPKEASARDVGVHDDATAPNSGTGTPAAFSRTNTLSMSRTNTMTQGVHWGENTVGHSVQSSGRTSPSNNDSTSHSSNPNLVQPSTHAMVQ
ncbi:hypothetical protein A1Q2_00221 [Trichosporon asahii var. asahii CBS 8904]|uniref:Cation/H+ exchanger transmembrane domain-containing protein n=1 Tax=Trichosporon asahii var. asahii (strain CBS 8904) TaxID=1220162 RepID=K1VMN1_TRIAC|nr:hypothetical protein A1Q2_00221 [Trichosporon asahii var. asahii CBS 8904]